MLNNDKKSCNSHTRLLFLLSKISKNILWDKYQKQNFKPIIKYKPEVSVFDL